MKSIALVGMITVLIFGVCNADPKEEPFSQVGQAIIEVVVDYIKDSADAERFSVALLKEPSGFEEKQRYVPLSKADQANLERRMPKRWKLYVPLSELRIPRDNERDPNDPEGKIYRGIEAKDGKRISVFVISRIEYVNAQTLRIHWDYGSGPLSGHGGSLEVSRVKGPWKIKSIDAYDR